MPPAFWIAVAVALLVSFALDWANTSAGGAIDLRNRITGARLLESGLDPYTYKWTYGAPDIYCDVYNNPHLAVSKTTATPALLLVHAPVAALPYRDGEFVWLIAQWLLLLGMGWLWLRAAETEAQRVSVALLFTAFTYTAAWRLHAERGQAYVLLAFGLAAWLVLTRRPGTIRPWLIGAIAGGLIALRPTFALLVPFLVLHRRAQLLGALAGLAAGVLVPLAVHPSGWTEYFSAMETNSELYRNDVNPRPGAQRYPGELEGTPTKLLGAFAVIPYADFSAFAFLRWIGFENEWLGDEAWPAWPPLLFFGVGFGLWLIFTRRDAPETLLAGLAAWVFLADLFLPAYRDNYNDVLALDFVTAGLVTSRAIPWAVWPWSLALPFGLLVYVFASEQVMVINFPTALLTVSAVMFLFGRNRSHGKYDKGGIDLDSCAPQATHGHAADERLKVADGLKNKKPNILSTLFSFQGRVDRKTWWSSFFVGTAVIAFCTFYDLSARDKGQDSFLTLISIAIIGWPLLAIQVKRWHDRNKSGFWSLIGLIPYVGSVWIIVELGFLGPIEEGNQY